MAQRLSIEGVSVDFGGLKAVHDASLEIAPGEIVGLIGPNGAGKTTLFNAISGLVPVSSGQILIDDVSLSDRPAHERSKFGIARTFQAVQLIQDSSVIENIMIGMHSRLDHGLFDLFGQFRTSRSQDYVAQKRAYEVLERLSLGDLALTRVSSLDFGQQRRVEIARALVSEPRLLLLDEPAAGLGPDEVEDLEALLVLLTRKSGLSMLIVEHVLSLVFKLCDRIVVLDNGSVIATGLPAEIADNAEVRRAYLGDVAC
ncbi:ABC transporter ATP-binding protein [Bradyrhizobium niftali]|uniref:ABC transporter ATP-binding protein n=1 Tax=Bradyrhizobium niftali TaxID=2560055 RepID=A0A4Y9M8H0_9BRAD|nr:ABC transporter ATP-binding protein [Bradyrhizobium niftali]TFV51337.1 ABC transporter ATP-binding protein [Bradyrhizobium niftali]